MFLCLCHLDLLQILLFVIYRIPLSWLDYGQYLILSMLTWLIYCAWDCESQVVNQFHETCDLITDH